MIFPSDESFSTKAIHEGQDPNQWSSKSLVPPIVLATTFKQDYPGKPVDYDYGRSGNPTRTCLQSALASIENAKFAYVYSSGLGATTTISYLLQSGDHMISGNNIYGGTYRIMQKCFTRMGIEVTFVDTRKVENVTNAVKENTRMVWLETPTNPSLQLADIQLVSQNLKKMNQDIILVVDNTFMTSYFQKPLELGADISFYSCTKYINGHSDIIMGAIITNRQDLAEQLKFLQNALGIVSSPFDCFLVNRGIKTLELRMKQHMVNGFAVANFLESHDKVDKVSYPGLKSHPQHDVALKQCSGFSGMVSCYIKGDVHATLKFVQSLKVFKLAESLGCVESLAEIPSLMTHTSVPESVRASLGITDNLVRLSVGIESTQDLINDLKQALDKAFTE